MEDTQLYEDLAKHLDQGIVGPSGNSQDSIFCRGGQGGPEAVDAKPDPCRVDAVFP